MSENENAEKAVNCLREGFKYSSLTLALIVLFSLPMVNLVTTILTYGVPFFLVLITWALGLYKRRNGWSLLGQKHITRITAVFSIILFLSIFPITQIVGRSLFSHSSFPYYAFMLTPVIAWGIYTISESQGLKQLKESCDINLQSSTICSLLGVFVYTVCFITSLVLNLPYLDGYGIMFAEYYSKPLLFAFPFLIASCTLAIKNLKIVH